MCIRDSTKIVLTQPKLINENNLDEESFWDEKDSELLSFSDTENSDSFIISYDTQDEVLGVVSESDLGITYDHISREVHWVYSRNNPAVQGGTAIRFQPLINPGSTISNLGDTGLTLNSKFHKTDGIIADITPKHTWFAEGVNAIDVTINPLPDGFAGIARSTHIFVYREMAARRKTGFQNTISDWQFDNDDDYLIHQKTYLIDALTSTTGRYARLRENAKASNSPPNPSIFQNEDVLSLIHISEPTRPERIGNCGF